MGGGADLSKTYWNLKTKMWATMHFAASNHNSKKALNTKNVWHFSLQI